MAVKLSSSELPEFSLWLEQHFPSSIRMLGELKSHMRGKFPGLDFFVDRWPHPQAAIAIVDPNNQQLDFKDSYENVIYVFGVRDDALISLLKADRFIDWSQAAYFRSVPAIVGPALVSLVEENAGVNVWPLKLLKATPSDLKPVPVPHGMQISTVTDAEVDIVNSEWALHNQDSSSYIRHLHRHFHSVVMRTACGQHVGHMLHMSDGIMGMLYVTPHFRKQGYAKVIITQLALKVFSDEEAAYVFIRENNPVSINAHLSVGFKPCSSDRFIKVNTFLLSHKD